MWWWMKWISCGLLALNHSQSSSVNKMKCFFFFDEWFENKRKQTLKKKNDQTKLENCVACELTITPRLFCAAAARQQQFFMFFVFVFLKLVTYSSPCCLICWRPGWGPCFRPAAVHSQLSAFAIARKTSSCTKRKKKKIDKIKRLSVVCYRLKNWYQNYV